MDVYREIERRVEKRLFEENTKIFKEALNTTKRICPKCNFQDSRLRYILLISKKKGFGTKYTSVF